VEFCGYKARANKERRGGRDNKRATGRSHRTGGKTKTKLGVRERGGTERNRTRGKFWSINQQHLVLLPPLSSS